MIKKAAFRTSLAATGAIILLAIPPIGFAVAAQANGAAAAAQVQAAAAEAAQARIEAAAASVARARQAAEAVQALRADAAAAAEAQTLRPGEFVWQPERAQAGRVEIVVSIPLQRAFVYRGGTLIGLTTVSTGRPGHATPTGSFTILQKRPRHFSNLYNNAPMPYMQRLTWDGIALHAGHIPGRPASHGCVRLPLAFARHLFEATELGASVHIIRASPSAGEALAMVRGNGAYQGMGGPDEDED